MKKKLMILLLGTALAFQSIMPAMAETTETQNADTTVAETESLATETKIDLDDTYMNVIQFGSGDKNLVILSGVSLCGLEGKGEGVAAAYSQFTNDYTVYLFDRKKILPDGYQVADMAEDVYRVLNILEVEDAYVYGVSQGGMMALSLAANHPDMVKGLVVCSSQAHATDTLKQVASKWIDLAQAKDVVGLNRNFFEVVYSEEYLSAYAEYLPVLEQEGTPKDCERFVILAQACLDFDITDSLDQIQCPVLVLGDENDHTIGVEGTRELAELLNCSSYIYDQYSHAVYDEAPDIQEKIYTFLQTLD